MATNFKISQINAIITKLAYTLEGNDSNSGH